MFAAHDARGGGMARSDHPPLPEAARRAAAGVAVPGAPRSIASLMPGGLRPVAGPGEEFHSLVRHMFGIVFRRTTLTLATGAEETRVFGADAPLFGFEADESGRADLASWRRLIDPRDRAAHERFEARRRRFHQPQTVEYRIVHPDGSAQRWVREVGWVLPEIERGRLRFDSYLLDVTTQKRTEAALERSRRRYRRLVERAPVAILELCASRILYANACAARLLGASRPEELLDRTVEDFRLDVAAAGGPVRIERWRALDGRVLALEVARVSPGEAGLCQLVLVDLTARMQEVARMRRLALHDPLTGLANRLLFFDRLEFALEAARRDGRRVALHMLDLDGFKPINDRYGHPLGDAFLGRVATELRRLVRRTDTVARLGGDEFAIVQPHLVSAELARRLAERVLAIFARPFELGGRRLSAGVSIGIAIFPDDARDAEALLRLADAALYRAKRSGRGRILFAEPQIRPHPSGPPSRGEKK